jgi:hypothetical protein
MIHVIGDSHVSVFTGLHGVCPRYDEARSQAMPGFRVWHVGAYLAFSVSRAGHEARRRVRACLAHAPAGARLLMCFGEIDCRNHVVKRAAGDRRISGVAAGVARAYVRAAARLARGRDLAFMDVPPPTVAQHGNTIQPTQGTFAQRRRAVEAFNRAMKREARAVGARVVSAGDELATREGEPNPAYFADGVHVDPRALPVLLAALAKAGWAITDPTTHVAAASLAAVPPPPTLSLPGGLNDAGAARAVLLELALSRCRALGATSIAILGAGKHTRELPMEAVARAGLSVAAILDDEPRVDHLGGVPVRRLDRGLRGFGAVLVSSDAHEQRLMERAHAVLGRAMPVVPIYSWRTAPPAPALKSARR